MVHETFLSYRSHFPLHDYFTKSPSTQWIKHSKFRVPSRFPPSPEIPQDPVSTAYLHHHSKPQDPISTTPSQPSPETHHTRTFNCLAFPITKPESEINLAASPFQPALLKFQLHRINFHMIYTKIQHRLCSINLHLKISKLKYQLTASTFTQNTPRSSFRLSRSTVAQRMCSHYANSFSKIHKHFLSRPSKHTMEASCPKTRHSPNVRSHGIPVSRKWKFMG